MSDFELVAEKRPWVPDWLWRIACHWMPLASALSWPPRCQWVSLGVACWLPANAHYYGAPPEIPYLGRYCRLHGAFVLKDAEKHR